MKRKNKKVNLKNISAFVMNITIGELEKDMEFKRSNRSDNFEYSNITQDLSLQKYNNSRSSIETTISIHQKAVEKIVSENRNAIRITKTFKQLEKEQEVLKETNNMIDEYFNSIKEELSTINETKVCKGCANSEIADLTDNKTFYKIIENLEFDLKKTKDLLNDYRKAYREIKTDLDDIYSGVRNMEELPIYEEIENKLKEYQKRFDNIEIIDSAEWDKIEEATVLENMITLLNYLKKF